MADISWRRDGEDSPFIQGMRELQEELRHWHEHPDDASIRLMVSILIRFFTALMSLNQLLKQFRWNSTAVKF